METCLLWVLSLFVNYKVDGLGDLRGGVLSPHPDPSMRKSHSQEAGPPLPAVFVASCLEKFCISLRVHKSWHVCKERHSKNSYASPYNKHVVNNLYLEANLSQGCGQSFKSETLQECSVLFFTGSSRGSPTWRFEGSLYWRSRSPLPKKRGICIKRCKRCIVISWELPFPMNVRLRTK